MKIEYCNSVLNPEEPHISVNIHLHLRGEVKMTISHIPEVEARALSMGQWANIFISDAQLADLHKLIGEYLEGTRGVECAPGTEFTVSADRTLEPIVEAI